MILSKKPQYLYLYMYDTVPTIVDTVASRSYCGCLYVSSLYAIC